MPPHATKQSHSKERDIAKVVALGVQYGMGASMVALSINKTTAVAQDLLRMHQDAYPEYWAWQKDVQRYASLHGVLFTTFNWRMFINARTKAGTIGNFLMQGNGSEMLRFATVDAINRGLCITALIHDAILLEAPLELLEDHTKQLVQCMEAANLLVLNDTLRVELLPILYPARFDDGKGKDDWNKIMGIMNMPHLSIP
jgi:DNA polymerase I-like protein with 3'-5' exonuclease and polymerase domains